MPPRIFGNILEVLGPWQGLQHLDGNFNVMVDDLTLCRRQCAGTYREILNFIITLEIAGLAIDVEPLVIGNLAHALLFLSRHRLATDVAMPQEFTVIIQLPDARFVFGTDSRFFHTPHPNPPQSPPVRGGAPLLPPQREAGGGVRVEGKN